MPEQELDDIIRQAADYLVAEHARGRIRGFGITSTSRTWSLREDLIKDSRFVAVEGPANLCEPKFMDPSFLDALENHKIALFTHRLISSLNTAGQPIRLASTPSTKYSKFWLSMSQLESQHADGIQMASNSLLTALETLTNLEEQICSSGTKFENDPKHLSCMY
jgi:aryl-alcohol dehydrogenase-like predicted oxidoreductase